MKLEVMHTSQMLPGECRALTRKMHKFLMLFPAEAAVFCGELIDLATVIVKVVMTSDVQSMQRRFICIFDCFLHFIAF